MPGACRSSSSSRGGCSAPVARSRVERRRSVLILMGVIAGAMLACVRVSHATNVLTDGPREGRGDGLHRRGFELGPTISLPLPIASASRERIGLSMGLALTVSDEPSGGFGAGVAYHHWPVSTGMKQAFEARLAEDTQNTLRLTPGTWELDVIRYGIHVQHLLPGTSPSRPWLRAGIHFYRLDPNIGGYTGDAGFFTVSAGPLRTTNHVGGSLAAGVNLCSAFGAAIGLEVDHHWVPLKGLYGDDLHVLSLGAHARFGKTARARAPATGESR